MMEYKGYVGQVEFDAETGILHGEVMGIRDVVTFQGKSSAEVEKAFHESVDGYLRLCKDRSEEPEKPGLGTRICQRFAECNLDEDVQIPEWRGRKTTSKSQHFGEG